MTRITSKLQVTVPNAIADRYGIRPGDEIEWIPAGDAIRVIAAGAQAPPEDAAARLRLFDQATGVLAALEISLDNVEGRAYSG